MPSPGWRGLSGGLTTACWAIVGSTEGIVISEQLERETMFLRSGRFQRAVRQIGQQGLVALLVLIAAGCGASKYLKMAATEREAGNKVAAFRHYQQHLQEKPGDIEARNSRDELAKELTGEVQARVEEALSDSTAIDEALLRSQLDILEQNREFDVYGTAFTPIRSRIQDLMLQLEQQRQAKVMQYRNALRRGDIEEATTLLSDLRGNGEQSELESLESQFVGMYENSLDRRLDQLFAENHIQKAKLERERLESVALSADKRDHLIAAFKEKMASRLLSRAEEDVRSRRYYRAYRAIVDSGMQDDFVELLNLVQGEGAKFYLDQASKRLRRRELYRAYLAAAKGYELDRNYPGMVEMIRDTRDQLVPQLQRYIAVTAFGAPVDQPDLGPQFSDALISELFRDLPYGTNILERQKIDLVLAEQKRDYKQASQILNVDLIVTGNVSVFDIDRQRSETTSTTRAKVGERRELNPEYEALVKLHGDNIEDLKDVPERVIAVPEFQLIPYSKGRVVLKGYAAVSVRIFDAKKGG
ncbi:MAG: hypothetical protein KDD44_02305, partial [Bdellovibrionales bacterium]|nr:hypothetical protein [Bdellovibrionales bacterium]